MTSFKFIHTADIHLKNINDDAYDTFVKIISLTKNKNIDFLLIAGDLFDSANPDKHLVDKVKELFEFINNCRVLITPGNHDPLVYNSPYLAEEWPENVFIFKEKLSFVTLGNIRFYGRAFTSHFEEDSLLAKIKLDGSYANILIMHGEVTTSSMYNPIPKNLLDEIGFDYCALGHVHKPIANAAYTFPGTPEGRGFDEIGELGIVVGYIEKGDVNTKFYPISKKRYVIKELDITNLISHDAILSRINEECTSSKDHYRIILKGTVKTSPDTKVLESVLSPYYAHMEIIDETVMSIDYERLKKENTLKGIFLRNMLDKMRNEPDNRILAESLMLGLKAFDEDIEV
jgi:exonuclease SbcD